MGDIRMAAISVVDCETGIGITGVVGESTVGGLVAGKRGMFEGKIGIIGARTGGDGATSSSRKGPGRGALSDTAADGEVGI